MQTLETSLIDQKLAFLVLGTMYASLAVSTLFISPLLIAILSPKYALLIFSFVFALFTFLNIIPSYYTLLPCSVLLGIADSILWASQGKLK